MPKVARGAPVLDPLLVIVKGPTPTHALLFYAVGPVRDRPENRDEDGSIGARTLGVRRADGARPGWEGRTPPQLEVGSGGKDGRQVEFTVRLEIDG